MLCWFLLYNDVRQLWVSEVAQSCPTLCDPMNCSTPGLPVHHQLLEFTQTHVHWVGDAIQPSYPLLSPSLPALNLSQPQGLFKWVSSSHQVAKVLEFQLQHQFPSNEHPGLISFRMDWLVLLAVQGTLKSFLQYRSSKASILRRSAFFIVQLSHPYMTTGKTIALTRRTFVTKVMPLLFNMLSSLVITFLPRSKHLLISLKLMQSPRAVILEPRKIKSVTVSTVSPSISHDVMEPDAMISLLFNFAFSLLHTHTHTYTQTHPHKCEHTHPHTHKMTTENYFKVSKSLNWLHILFTDCVFTVIYEIFACRRGWENFFIKGQMVNDVGFVIYTISASANLIPSYSVKAVTKRKKIYTLMNVSMF